jgi:glycosyltransferase involved in cell wall biosynthesis
MDTNNLPASAATGEDNTQPVLSLAVPFYNEEEIIDHFFEVVLPIMDSLSVPFEIVCVNDGSHDRTWEMLCGYAEKNMSIRVLELSRNFGKEAALTAALDHCRGQAVVPIDADLQDPPELIPEMLQKWRDGYEVVLARRKSRESDSFTKKHTSKGFYRILNLIADTDIPPHVGDFRLIDRKVLQAMQQLHEQNRFMKGLFAWVGYKSTTLEFDRRPRAAGITKWHKWKLWNHALDGIFAFSVKPLKLFIILGGVVSLFSFIYASLLIIRTLAFGRDVPGYASLMVVILLLGGIQLIGLGVLGEYLGRIYKEVKKRPLYLIRKKK